MSSTAPLAKKLALKPGQRFLLLGAPAGYAKSLGPLPAGVTLATKPGGTFDAIQVFVSTRAGLEAAVEKAKPALAPGGMLWVTYPKGTSKIPSEVNRDTVRAYAQTQRLQAVALVAVDDDWSALRLKRA